MIASDRRRELLGTGAVATVFSEWDPLLHRAVAVKELNAPAAASEAFTHAFLARARCLFDLDHANVLAVYRALDDRRQPALVRELADETLEAVAATASLSASQVEEILRQALSGLQAMHEQGIVHGAVKPQNLFRCGERYKVGDFGVIVPGGEDVAADSSRYTAPERLRGEPGDAASDLYSLGFVAYELLLGAARVEALGRDALGEPAAAWDPRGDDALWQRFHASPVNLPAPHQLLAECPMELSTTIQKMMRKNRVHRAAIASEGLAWLGGQPTEPAAASPVGAVAPRAVDLRLQPPAKKPVDTRTLKRAVSIAIGALVLVAIVVAVLFVRSERPEASGRPLSVAHAAPAAAAASRPPAPPLAAPAAGSAPVSPPPAGSPVPAAASGVQAVPSHSVPALGAAAGTAKPGAPVNASSRGTKSPPLTVSTAGTPGTAEGESAKPVAEAAAKPEAPNDSAARKLLSASDLIHAIYPAHYRLGVLHSGRRAYVDLNGVFADVPEDLENLPCIETAAADGGGKESVTFTLSQPARAYVGYDRRIENPPEWVRAFNRRNGPLSVFVRGEGGKTEVIELQLLFQSYPAGQVTLGPNLAKRSFLGRIIRRPQASMYVVCVDPR